MPACLPVSSMFVHKAEFIPELIKTFCVNMSLWDLCVHGERDWPIIAKGGVSDTHQKASEIHDSCGIYVDGDTVGLNHWEM